VSRTADRRPLTENQDKLEAGSWKPRMKFRPLLFWPHLAAGIGAGAIVLIMSVTGVLLAYEKQMIAWADERTPIEAAGRERLSPEALLSRVTEQTDSAPTSLILASAERPVLASAGSTTLLVDPYSGAVLGESAPRLRKFFRAVTDWHRWLAMSGEGRAAGKWLTGWANVLFLFLVLSGMYLWLPRGWSWRHVRPLIWFRRTETAKARDFNWHHAIGIWTAIPLALVVASAMPISFPWANTLVYRIVGEEPPAPASRPAAPAGQSSSTNNSAAGVDGLDAAAAVAVKHVSDWRTITARMPASTSAPFVFTIDRGTAGQPQYRGTLTVARDGQVRWEPFDSLTAGRRLRSFSRFLHTGEVFGIPGQTIAALASGGAVFLVWTGTALAVRRLWASLGRRRREDLREERAAA
jgi:uncharacterized iron-regulated membrane protein